MLTLMTDKTVTFGLRVPVEVKEIMANTLTRKCFEEMAKQIERGEIKLSEKGIVIPDKCADCTLVAENDPDGEWLRDFAHDVNLSVDVVKKKMAQWKGW